MGYSGRTHIKGSLARVSGFGLVQGRPGAYGLIRAEGGGGRGSRARAGLESYPRSLPSDYWSPNQETLESQMGIAGDIFGSYNPVIPDTFPHFWADNEGGAWDFGVPIVQVWDLESLDPDFSANNGGS